MIAEETEAKGIFVLSLPDEELARLAAGGRLDCFEELLARYRDRVYRICYRCAGNADDAEDWAQECFVRTFRQLGHFDPSLPFAPWLLRLVANTCINLAKARARHAEPCEPNFLAELAGADWEPDPLQKLVAGEEESVILGAIAGLPPALRIAVTLRVVDELSFRELSEVLGVPLQTAATRVRRALEQVRQTLMRQNHAPKSTQGRAAEERRKHRGGVK